MFYDLFDLFSGDPKVTTSTNGKKPKKKLTKSSTSLELICCFEDFRGNSSW
jgi:hypothetical protein